MSIVTMTILITLAFIHGCFNIVMSDPCNPGWFYFEGSCYGFGENEVSWGSALAICRAYGGKLVEIETAEENAWIKTQLTTKHLGNTWAGGNDLFHEGIWEWESSRQQIGPFSDWATTQPDEGLKGEDCLEFLATYSYQWNDRHCDEAHTFICEAEPNEAIVG